MLCFTVHTVQYMFVLFSMICSALQKVQKLSVEVYSPRGELVTKSLSIVWAYFSFLRKILQEEKNTALYKVGRIPCRNFNQSIRLRVRPVYCKFPKYALVHSLQNSLTKPCHGQRSAPDSRILQKVCGRKFCDILTYSNL